MTSFSSWRHFACTKEFPYIAFRVFFFSYSVLYHLSFNHITSKFPLSFPGNASFKLFLTATAMCIIQRVHSTHTSRSIIWPGICHVNFLIHVHVPGFRGTNIRTIRKRRIYARNVWNLKITTIAVLLINPLKTNSSDLPLRRGQILSS